MAQLHCSTVQIIYNICNKIGKAHKKLPDYIHQVWLAANNVWEKVYDYKSKCIKNRQENIVIMLQRIQF